MNELFSKLYKEAEKIKQWKLTVETELNQKERKLQENKKTIEAQNKAIQELQFENENLHLKLEDEICENKDLLKEAAASRHLCNLLKETCTRFTEKTSKHEQEKAETIQLYEELHSNIERMTAAFEELRVQAENDRSEMSFKLKEEAEKVDKFEKECKLEVSQKEKQISALTIERDEKDDVIKDIKAQLQTSQNKIADLMEAKLHHEEMLKESQVSKEHLRAELEEAKMSLQKAEVTQKNLETELQTRVKTLIQVTGEKEEQEEECKKMKALLAALTEEFETSVANLKSLMQEEQNRLKKYEDDSKLLTLELQKKSAELEEMTKVKWDKEVQLEELSEILKEFQDLKAQLTSTAEKEQDYLKQLVTLKTDLEQEALRNEQLTVYLSKLSLEKEQTAQEKNAVAAEVKKLQEQQEMNNLKKQVENKTKCIEELQQENKVLQKKLTAESKKSNTYEGKNEYDKMVEEKDAELKVYKMKQQKQFSSARALENELSSLKSELASIREQLKAEIEEKENLVKEHSHSMIPESEKKHKTYAIKTPPMDKMHSGRSTNLPSEQSSRKRQKVLVQLDTQSDSSEHTDLLSIVLEEEMFKNLYKDFPQASRLHSPAPKKLHPV
ncbi:synaptonemal complex protein 1-like isoform X5 [Molothrus ater]|uniref:synaptonemal complex protein 1-like isoform X5 n=1 Tax=Molothrus ater TaxID=84834 RepID=UPI0023E79554|nr:synaptonemal complex protein 1-like isoform X5 [Molothrus ater]